MTSDDRSMCLYTSKGLRSINKALDMVYVYVNTSSLTSAVNNSWRAAQRKRKCILTSDSGVQQCTLNPAELCDDHKGRLVRCEYFGRSISELVLSVTGMSTDASLFDNKGRLSIESQKLAKSSVSHWGCE